MTIRLTVPEMIETIVLSHLQYGSGGGRFGTITPVPGLAALYRVVLMDGKTFIVCECVEGWRVTWKGFVGIARDLSEAARLAFEADPGGNVATRDFPVRY